LSGSLDGSISILDYKRDTFMNLYTSPQFKTYTCQLEEIKSDRIDTLTVSINVLDLESLIVNEIDPRTVLDHQNQIYFKKKDLPKLNFGTSGGSVFNNFFGINTPEGSIQIFYFASINTGQV
jgi:hypothetical protein